MLRKLDEKWLYLYIYIRYGEKNGKENNGIYDYSWIIYKYVFFNKKYIVHNSLFYN